MGLVKAHVSEAAFEQLWGASGLAFTIVLFGEWNVSKGAPSLGESMVVTRVPEHLTEQQVVDELIEGMVWAFPRQLGPSCPCFTLNA